MMYKCEKCGFECASEKLLTQHKEREEAGLTETQQRFAIRAEQRDKLHSYIASKENHGN